VNLIAVDINLVQWAFIDSDGLELMEVGVISTPWDTCLCYGMFGQLYWSGISFKS